LKKNKQKILGKTKQIAKTWRSISSMHASDVFEVRLKKRMEKKKARLCGASQACKQGLKLLAYEVYETFSY
jgi:hypothetical protein